MTWSFLAKMELTKAEIQTSIKTTWSLHKNRGKGFIFKHFVIDCWVHYFDRLFDHTSQKIGSGGPILFFSLKQKIHKANQEGLTSLN